MNIRALSYSTSLTIFVITVLTIVAELNSGVKQFLTTIGTHHWIGKGIVGVVVCLVSYFLFRSLCKNDSPERGLYGTIMTTVISIAVLAAFFVLEYAEVL